MISSRLAQQLPLKSGFIRELFTGAALNRSPSRYINGDVASFFSSIIPKPSVTGRPPDLTTTMRARAGTLMPWPFYLHSPIRTACVANWALEDGFGASPVNRDHAQGPWDDASLAGRMDLAAVDVSS